MFAQDITNLLSKQLHKEKFDLRYFMMKPANV